MKKLPLNLKIYLFSIYLITFISLILFVVQTPLQFNVNNYGNIIFFIILTALTESFTVIFRNISFSTSFAITISFIYFIWTIYDFINNFILGFSI